MEITNKKSIKITPAKNNGIFVIVDNGPGYNGDHYVFTEWMEFFEFLNDFYTKEDTNEKNCEYINPWAVDGPVYGGGS